MFYFKIYERKKDNVNVEDPKNKSPTKRNLRRTVPEWDELGPMIRFEGHGGGKRQKRKSGGRDGDFFGPTLTPWLGTVSSRDRIEKQ